MNHVWTVARKELRGYFNSAVALIFLATFLGVVLFTFFWVDKFFARGVADLRPMFDWMPLLLIFLVAALSMRLWSEERKTGTLEVLLTLPVPRWQLVLGKFVAGMILVALALGLTLGLPLTVSMMGDLDWGPVIGGYVAAFLLAGAYLAVGMCVSSTTDNQIVALIMTALVCLLLYLPGTGAVAGLVSLDTADTLRQLGTGSRFSSIARGVLDLRDLAYYLSLICVFLALDVVLLGARRWSKGPRARKQRFSAQLAVALVAANAIALNLWLAPVAQARVDLTENGDYSLSETTENMVSHLDEPLLIRAYFSSKMHPILAPLVPQVKDLLEEYRIAGDGRVRVETVDPTSSEELEKEAKDDYAIESVPLRFADRHEKGIVSTFFHILVQYGDQHEVLGFDDLIEVKSLDVGDISVKLKNLEYDLTRTIKKVVYGFQSLEALFAGLSDDVELIAYITPDTLPEQWKDGPAAFDKIVEEMTKQAGGRLKITKVAPKEDEYQAIFDQWGIRPYQSLITGAVYYFQVVVKVGNRAVRVPPPDTLDEATFRNVLTEAIQRAAPGFTKVIAIWTPPPGFAPPMQEGQQPRQTPPPETFETLQDALTGTYEVRRATLAPAVPADVDVLILAGPTGLGDAEVKAVDQFLMRGGALIVLSGKYRLDLNSRELRVQKVESGLDAMLSSYGVTVQDQLVLDREVAGFPTRTNKDLNSVTEKPYPYFLKVPDTRMPRSVITAGLPGVLMHWASPVIAPAPADGARKVEVLMKSTAASWLNDSVAVEPDYDTYKDIGFPPPPADAAKKGAQVLGVAITGGFDSHAAAQAKASAQGAPPPLEEEALIEHSPPDARLVVIGSSSFVSDTVLQISSQLGMDLAESNITLVQNAVDWALADTDLLAIRARSSGARALTVEEGERSKWEWINYGIAFAGLGVVVLLSWIRRRGVEPLFQDDDDEEVES